MAKNYRTDMDDTLVWSTRILRPLMTFYSRFLDTPYLADKMMTSGGYDIHSEYSYKVYSSFVKNIFSDYESSLKSVSSPSIYDTFSSNFVPLILLNPLQRLLTLIQAYPTLNLRFQSGGNYQQLATNLTQKGFFTSLFRGSIFSTFHFIGTMMPAMYLVRSNCTSSRQINFLLGYTVGSLFFYPLDTVKTILYADTRNSLRLKCLSKTVSFSSLYNGFLDKMVFRLPLLSALLYSASNNDTGFNACLALAAFIYPLNTLGVRKQIASTGLSTFERAKVSATVNAYRGVIPYFLAAYLFKYNVSPVFTQAKLNAMFQSAEKEAERFGQYQ